MSLPTSPPSGWKIRQIPWLEPGSPVHFSGEDLTLQRQITTTMTVGASLGRGGQAAVFSVNVPDRLSGNWAMDDVVLRVSYQDDDYGRDPRRTSIYQRLASIRDRHPESDPLEGLLRLHAVGHLPPPQYLPGQELWVQVLDRGGTSLQQWVSGLRSTGLGPQFSVAVMLPIISSLARCHSEGIVHRDIKPGNVFVTERCPTPAPPGLDGPRATRLFAAGLPFMRLGDLGSMTNLSTSAMARLNAKAAPETLIEDVLMDPGAGPDAMTHTFTTNIDTGPFTPPEVWTSAAQAEASPAGDVWQLAVTLFFACTGELPFQGWRGQEWRTERVRYVEATQGGEPNSEFFDDLPTRLQYLLRWCLTPDPLDRPDLSSLTDELTVLAWPARPRVELTKPAREVPQPAVTGPEPDHPATDVQPDAEPVWSQPRRASFGESSTRSPSVRHVVAQRVGGARDAASAAWAGPRRIRIVVGAALAAVLLAVGLTVTFTGRDGGNLTAAVTPPDRTVPAAPSLTKKVQWSGGKNLSTILPQLFADTPLAKRPELGRLKEGSYGFCNSCVGDGKVRLRVDVTPDERALNVKLVANAKPVSQPIGPYLALIAPGSQQFVANPLANEKDVREYPMATRFTSAKYQKVVLVAANRIGEGAGSTEGDTSWQTRVSNERTAQRLVFDMPGGSKFVTVLWFNEEGVVGFNKFETSHCEPNRQLGVSCG